MPKHAPVADAGSVAAYFGSGFVSPSLVCARCGWRSPECAVQRAPACLPVSQTHGAGEEPVRGVVVVVVGGLHS